MEDEVLSAHVTLAAAIALLRRLEWSGSRERTMRGGSECVLTVRDACPICQQTILHAPCCDLARLLMEVRS